VFGQIAEVRIARRAFRPRMANANDRTPIKQIIGMALILHPTAMNESVYRACRTSWRCGVCQKGSYFLSGNADSHFV
jgi:hypothetical protein